MAHIIPTLVQSQAPIFPANPIGTNTAAHFAQEHELPDTTPVPETVVLGPVAPVSITPEAVMPGER
ncbi:hypothetical protein FRC10_005429 [Ceratobasidium sp. 414]|nr:hypothetical protein FRC10_005429 [Ceratobasidium sp. 414]